MKDVDDISLVVTGCIKPNRNQSLYLKDSETRLVQYLDALRFYIDSSKFKNIVFCDNSGYFDQRIFDLTNYAKEKRKTFEFISFVGNDKCLIEYSNKGIGEAEIIDKVFFESKLIRNSYGFFKVTGRLKVTNINKIIKKTNKNSNTFLRYAYGGVDWLDTRLYYMSCSSYKENVSFCYERCGNYSLPLEQVFYILIRKYNCFRYYPKFFGISGGNGYDYSKMPQLEYYAYNIFCCLGMFNLIYPFFYYCRVVHLRLALVFKALSKRLLS